MQRLKDLACCCCCCVAVLQCPPGITVKGDMTAERVTGVDLSFPTWTGKLFPILFVAPPHCTTTNELVSASLLNIEAVQCYGNVVGGGWSGAIAIVVVADVLHHQSSRQPLFGDVDNLFHWGSGQDLQWTTGTWRR